ncbi:hypothetical protein GCM10027162_02310 [Streptomyces incanus]
MTGVLRKFRFRPGSGVPLWRHGTTPVLFVRVRAAQTLVDEMYGTEEACWYRCLNNVHVCVAGLRGMNGAP